MEHGRCVHVYVCLFACMLGREVYKEKKKKKAGHPTFEWEMFLQRGAKKNKKTEAIFYCERNAA